MVVPCVRALDVLRAVGHGRRKLARGESDSGGRGRSQESGGLSIHDNKCPSLGKPKERTMVTSIAWTKAALRGKLATNTGPGHSQAHSRFSRLSKL